MEEGPCLAVPMQATSGYLLFVIVPWDPEPTYLMCTYWMLIYGIKCEDDSDNGLYRGRPGGVSDERGFHVCLWLRRPQPMRVILSEHMNRVASIFICYDCCDLPGQGLAISCLLAPERLPERYVLKAVRSYSIWRCVVAGMVGESPAPGTCFSSSAAYRRYWLRCTRGPTIITVVLVVDQWPAIGYSPTPCQSHGWLAIDEDNCDTEGGQMYGVSCEPIPEVILVNPHQIYHLTLLGPVETRGIEASRNKETKK